MSAGMRIGQAFDGIGRTLRFIRIAPDDFQARAGVAARRHHCRNRVEEVCEVRAGREAAGGIYRRLQQRIQAHRVIPARWAPAEKPMMPIFFGFMP
jgi:hypothetical protein